MGEEGAQQLKLAFGQRTQLTVLETQLAAIVVQRTALAHRHHDPRWRGAVQARVAHATDQVLGTRQDLARVEGLGNVFVGAAFEADDAFNLILPSGHQDDADLRAHPQFARQRQAILARQTDVEQYQVDHLGSQLLLRVLGRRGFANVIALGHEVVDQTSAGHSIVIDDKHLRIERHGP